MNNTDGVRLDRWLWSARFFKTRQMAANAVQSGRVLLNDKRTKPAKSVRIGDQIRIRKAAFSLRHPSHCPEQDTCRCESRCHTV